MKAHPQLLNAWQVRAILDGRKTQLRIPTGRQGDLLPPVPRYAVGDLIWGREAFCAPFGKREAAYRADNDFIGCYRWRPSIHMPRWASRITLEVTGVRVERLQDISLADSIAEGVEPYRNRGGKLTAWRFPKHWEAIHGPGSWDANPWVQVIAFRRVDGAAALGAAA